MEHKAKIPPHCVVCLKTSCNAAMKPSLLKRHLENHHPNLGFAFSRVFNYPSNGKFPQKNPGNFREIFPHLIILLFTLVFNISDLIFSICYVVLTNLV